MAKCPPSESTQSAGVNSQVPKFHVAEDTRVEWEPTAIVLVFNE